MIHFLILFLLFSFVALPGANAQDTRLPDISVPPIEADVNRENRLNPRNFREYNIQNRYLGDKIELQYQIALINNLITWQKQVSEIQKAYSEIGIPYDDVKPPMGICEQIPANVPCYRAYPEIYSDIEENLQERRKELEANFLDDLKDKQSIEDLISSVRPELSDGDEDSMDENVNPKATKKKKKEQTAQSDFVWVDIACLSGDCSAVLSRTSDANFRVSVNVGQKLADGGEVTKIQPGRVEILTKDRLPQSLKPAPADGFASSSSRPQKERKVTRGNLLEQFSTGGIGRSQVTGQSGGNSSGSGQRSSTPLDDLPPLEGIDVSNGLF